MNPLTKFLLEDILEADNKKITAIYGGGFKPPTKGHFDVVQKAAEQNPEIDEFIIYVGGGVRDGIAQAESIMIWELYKKYLPLKVRVEPVKTPVGDILRYAKEHPEEEVLWVIGARENNPEDFMDISSRTRTMEKYPNLKLRVIQTSGGVSGTAARKAVKDNNKEQFFHLIPDIEEKEQVWDIVSPLIKENIFKDLKGALKSIWSKGGKLTQDIIDGAKREGKETSKLIQLLNKMLHGDSITDDEKTFMKAQGKDLLKVLPLVAIQGIPLPIPITPLLLVLGKKFGFNILPDSHEVMPLSNLAEIVTEYNNTGPSTPKVYIVKADGNYKEVPIEILSKIPNLTYDMGGGETNFFPEKNIVIVDNIPVKQFAQEPGEIKDEKIYVEYNLNQPFSFPKANKIIASQIVYHLGDIKSFAKTINDSLKNGGTFQFFSDLMNKQDKEFLNYLSSEYEFGLPKNLNPYKGGNLLLKKGAYTEPVISYIYSVTDANGNTAKMSVTKEGRWWKYDKIEGDIDFKPSKWSVEPEYKYNDITPSKENVLDTFSRALETDIVDFKKLNENLIEIVTDTDIICDNCGWDWPIADGGDDLYICHKCGHDNNPDLEEGTCGYDTDVKTGKKLDTPGGLEEGRPKKPDPKKGTGKKPEGSSRRLYTDEDPKDTVSIKFKTKEDIVDTLNKKQFKAKAHARQSQVINLIHQRVRAAYSKSKDPEVRSRLKRALDYIEKRKEMSKKKTERLRKLNENSIPSINVKEKLDQINKYMISKGYNIEPLPSVEIIDSDKENAEDFLGKTAYYDPNEKKIVLYTFGRHPKDISRSYTHEMIHHIQNLEDRLGSITTTNTLEDDHLDKIEQEANLKGTMMFRNFTDSLQEKKDPFGLNAYARELALGLEEKLNEGRYDSIVTQLARYTIKGWKDDQEHGEPIGRVEFEIGPGKDLEYGDLEFLYKGVAVFAGIESYAYNGYAKSVSGEVGLEFAIPTSELPKMWEQIYNDITNTLRHEIEHLTQGGKNVKSNKAMASDSDLRNQLDTDGNTVDYYLLPKEIDANLQGLYLKAKKTKQPFDKVVDSYLKYNLNLSLDDQEKVKNAWRPRIKALSLPKI